MPSTTTSVDRVGALLAIWNWMGTYESTTGQPLEDVDRENPRLTPQQIERRFDIPADIVAGYRLAAREYESAHRTATVRKNRADAVAALRKQRPDLSIEAIRAHVASVIR